MKRKSREITNYQGWNQVVDHRETPDLDDIDLPPGPRGPQVIPMYGCKSYTPLTECSDIHRGPIRPNSMVYCEVCGRAGCDHWPRLEIPKNPIVGKGRPRYVKRKLRGGIGV